ncbi:MAG: hypothetical protein M3552_11205 [Planctomycetota bacterium]|nr:hypothetical protein [Planctomycetaceae bacterium]MDQ3331204.1 hypothetical protein [Planctomycetota bacterium]
MCRRWAAIRPRIRGVSSDRCCGDTPYGPDNLDHGTGFPQVFYLRYHYYRHYFPLMALARYEKATR